VKISCDSPFKGSYVHFPSWPGHILLLFCLACSLRSATLNIPHTIVHPAVLYWTFYSCYTSYNTVFIQSRLNSKLFLSKFYNLFLNQNHNGADIFHGCILTSCNTVYTILLASSGYILLYRCTVHLSLHKASWCFRCTLSSAKRHHHILYTKGIGLQEFLPNFWQASVQWGTVCLFFPDAASRGGQPTVYWEETFQ
jgi:hypothetical protein